MFQLTKKECLRCQIGILNGDGGRGQHLKYMPYAFTEQGVAMLSSVLRSKAAAAVNIAIMRAFVAVRQMLFAPEKMTKEIEDIKRRVAAIEQREDETLKAINDLSEDMREELDNIYLAIGELSRRTSPQNPASKRKPIGYKREEE